MTYVEIDTSTIQGKKFVELIETLPFAKVIKEPNPVTKKAMDEAKKGKSTKHNNLNDLVSFLNQ